MAVAYLHLTPDQFGEMLPGEFYAGINAFYRMERDRQKFTAELFRMQTADLLNIQLKKKDRIKPAQLWAFDWDNEQEEEKPVTTEEIKRHNEEIMKRFNGTE